MFCHSSLSESSGKIPTINGSKNFLFHIYSFSYAYTLVWASSSVFKYCFATIPVHSAPYPVFQAQRVAGLSGIIYMQGDPVHSSRGSVVYVH